MASTDYFDRQIVFRGPLSVVYRAKHAVLGTVAVKCVDVDFCSRPHDINEEIRLVKAFQRPDLVLQYVADHVWGDDKVLVTPYYEWDLERLMAAKYTRKSLRWGSMDGSYSTKNTLAPRDARKIAAKLAAALAYLHDECGVIHRDIKPSNVFFRGSELDPVLGDFGISYDTRSPPSEEADSGLKVTDVGTGYYKAPELCFGVTSYGFEVDMWAFGVVLSMLYSKNGRPILEDGVDDGADEDGRLLTDLVLISTIFRHFGTPTVKNASSSLYWPEMASDDYHFTKFSFDEVERWPAEKLLRNADGAVLAVFAGTTTYDRGRRMTAAAAVQALE